MNTDLPEAGRSRAPLGSSEPASSGRRSHDPAARRPRAQAVTREVTVGAGRYVVQVDPVERDHVALRITHVDANGIRSETGYVHVPRVHLPRLVQGVLAALRTAVPRRETPSYAAVSQLRETYPASHSPWSVEEDERLVEEFRHRRSTSEISGAHGRTPGAIESRLLKLGLLTRQDLEGR